MHAMTIDSDEDALNDWLQSAFAGGGYADVTADRRPHFESSDLQAWPDVVVKQLVAQKCRVNVLWTAIPYHSLSLQSCSKARLTVDRIGVEAVDVNAEADEENSDYKPWRVRMEMVDADIVNWLA